MNHVMVNGSDRDKQEIMLFINESQLRDTQKIMTDLSEHCYGTCVTTFTTSHLDAKEKTCLSQCSRRYLDFFKRSSLRFAEINQAKAMEQQQQ